MGISILLLNLLLEILLKFQMQIWLWQQIFANYTWLD